MVINISEVSEFGHAGISERSSLYSVIVATITNQITP